MCETYLDQFKREMAPAKEIYTKEIRNFSRKFDFLGELTIIEEPDIDTQDYIYSFENLNGTSSDVLRSARKEINEHMRKFSKEKGIFDFYINTSTTFDRWF